MAVGVGLSSNLSPFYQKGAAKQTKRKCTDPKSQERHSRKFKKLTTQKLLWVVSLFENV